MATGRPCSTTSSTNERLRQSLQVTQLPEQGSPRQLRYNQEAVLRRLPPGRGLSVQRIALFRG